MEERNTKKVIIDKALELFSIKGFDGVTVADIAGAVGIKAPSLYKHYDSKQAIFDAILAEMEVRYEQQASSMQLDGKDAKKDKDYYADMSEERLIEIGQGLFMFFLHDEYTSRFRKMLTIEKYNNQVLATLNARRYIDDSLSYQKMLFGMLSEAGLLLPENPHIMALHFYSPLFLLLDLCDCCPEREPEALQLIEQHIKQFSRLYKAVSEV